MQLIDIAPAAAATAKPPASPPAEARHPVLVIAPARGWALVNVRELWAHRELLFFLVWRDIKVRYKQTLLGAAWAVLQPVLMMIVFTIFFGKMAAVPTGGLPYPVFVFAGLLPWSFFSTAIASAGNSVVGSERLITKIYFPRLAVPFAAVGAALADFAIAFGVLIAMMMWYHIVPSVAILWTPVLMALLTLAALGVGTLLAALNVAYRDFRYVIPFLVQLWMFATPTIYMDTHAKAGASLPTALQTMLALNPITALVGAFRSVTIGGPFSWSELGIAAGIVLVLFLVGCLYFRRVEDSFADII